MAAIAQQGRLFVSRQKGGGEISVTICRGGGESQGRNSGTRRDHESSHAANSSQGMDEIRGNETSRSGEAREK